MNKSKLVAYLSKLDKDEIIQLQCFIRSPFFFDGRGPGMALQLLDYMLPFYPDFSSDQLTKEAVFEYFYEGQKFEKIKVELLMSRLFKILERFISHQYHAKTEVDQQLALARFHREKKMVHYQELGIKKMKTLQKKQKLKDAVFYKNQFLIAREGMLKESVQQLRNSDLNLPEIHRYLDRHYLLLKLRYSCYLLAQNKHHIPVPFEEALNVLDLLKPVFEKDTFKEVPLLQLYYTIYLWLRDGKELPENFIEKLRALRTDIPPEQLNSIHSYYRNYCIRKHNEGNRGFLHKIFEMYCLSLEEGVLLTNGGLTPSLLQAIVNTGLKLKKYDWTLDFLKSYQDKIVATPYPKEIYQNNLAKYHFATQAFDKALDCIHQECGDTYYKINAKLLEIKIYYEQQNDLLEPKMQALKMYLYRISDAYLSAIQKEAFRNFIDLLKQIRHPRTLKNEKRIDKLLDKLSSTKVIAEREWLSTKLAELR